MKLEEYIEIFRDEFDNQLVLDKEQINKEFRTVKNQNEWKSFLNELFKKCCNQQNQNSKNPIQYMVVHILRASVRCKTYEYMFALYDEQLYFDRQEVCSYWSFPGFQEIANNTIKHFSSLIHKKCIRVPESDIKEVCEWYLYSLMKEMSSVLLEAIARADELSWFQKMDKSENFGIYAGGYLDLVEKLKNAESAG